jgi:hypothetical protein
VDYVETAEIVLAAVLICVFLAFGYCVGVNHYYKDPQRYDETNR